MLKIQNPSRKMKQLILCVSYNLKCYSLVRRLASQAVQIKEETVENLSEEWSLARPFESLPGPSKYQLIRGFLPGGRYYKNNLTQNNAQMRKDYGDIFRMPGIFGKKDIIFTFNPNDFRTVFRTEGLQPVRPGMEVMQYYRSVLRRDIYENAAGLVAEGSGWGHFRSTVNPILMNHKTIKVYTPRMNKVVSEFIKRIRHIRDPLSNEVPSDFEVEINNWTMDTVCLVALDAEVGMINNSAENPTPKALRESMKNFFELLYQLEMQPSTWKYIATPKYKKAIKALDQITDISNYYVDQAIQRFTQRDIDERSVAEKSVLERLLQIDRNVAVVMAMDILFAGVDTTTSAISGCLLCLAKNPEKQQKLREEILRILPTKESNLESENMSNLPYLRACIKEAIRIYPVAPGNFRRTGQDIVLSGYRVPKGFNIFMPEQLLSQDEKYYTHASQYLPERWLRGEAGQDANGCPMNKRDPFVYLPFGFGPRTCIGKRIVDLELEIALAKLVRNFDISFDYPTENIFKMTALNTPAKPLKFKFKDVNI